MNASVLTTDDPLYEELYDVRREAMEFGNLVEEDMNPKMNALRERGAVHKGTIRSHLGLPDHHRHALAEGRQSYCAMTYTAVEAAFRNGKALSSVLVHHPNPGEEQTMGILEMDGDQHKAYRRMLQPMFLKPRTLTWWRQRFINEIVETLIERMKKTDRADLNLDYCARVPVHTVTRAIGIDGDDALKFRNALIKSTSPGGTPAIRKDAGETVERMLLALIAERRAVPGDDVASGLIGQTLTLPDGTERPLTDREIMHNCKLVMIAGGGTSWRQFGITLWALLTNPDQFAAVKADRDLIENAIEESLRWNTTAPIFTRLAVEDVELEGTLVPEGSVLEVCIGTANRDPRRYDDPDTYNLHRKQQPHLGFAIGQHRCLGMDVARSEIVVGINALIDAFPNLRLDPDAPAPFLTGGLEQRGMSGLPVLLR